MGPVTALSSGRLLRGCPQLDVDFAARGWLPAESDENGQDVTLHAVQRGGRARARDSTESQHQQREREADWLLSPSPRCPAVPARAVLIYGGFKNHVQLRFPILGRGAPGS